MHEFINYRSNQDSKIPTEEFLCKISLYNKHNHAINSAAALKFRPLSDSVKEKLKHLFFCGHTASSASRALDMEYQLNMSEEYDILVADSSLFPSVSVIQHLFNREFCKLYGSKSGKDMLANLQLFCEDYNKSTTGKAAVLKDGGNLAVAICTPIMQRTAIALPQANELILVDASGNMDVENHRVYFFVVPCVAGGAPVGCVITDAEKQDIFETGKTIFTFSFRFNVLLSK